MTDVMDAGRAFAALAVGPAGDVHRQPGMTLRDWFAGQALTGLMADTSRADPQSSVSVGEWAELAYSMADAMLRSRSAPTQGGGE